MPLVIDDSNFNKLINDSPRGMLGLVHTETGRKAMEAAPPYNASFPVYPRSEWPELIKEQREKKRRISDYQKFKAHAQTGPTCWANGPAHAFTTQRVIQGLPLVYVSGNSVAVPISGGVRGGWEWDAGEYSLKHGWAPVSAWPNGSKDGSLNRNPEVERLRGYYKALQMYRCDSFDEFVSAALQPIPFVASIAYDWWSHVISGGDPLEIERGSFGWKPRNNWGDDWGEKNDYGFGGYVTMREGKGTPDSGFVYGPVLAAVENSA